MSAQGVSLIISDVHISCTYLADVAVSFSSEEEEESNCIYHKQWQAANGGNSSSKQWRREAGPEGARAPARKRCAPADELRQTKEGRHIFKGALV